MPIDKYERYQRNFSMGELYPNPKDGTCSCGCGVLLTGRRTRWATKDCAGNVIEEYFIIQGRTDSIRFALWKREEGFCQNCGVKEHEWHADHIIPVHLGGGGCTIDNFQTLCVHCHKIKSANEAAARAIKPHQGKLF